MKKISLFLVLFAVFAFLFVRVEAFEADNCIGYCVNPTNAGKVFQWGNAAWQQEWEGIEIVGDPGVNWRANDRTLIEQRGGMMALIANEQNKNLTVWATDTNARFGRWEARARAKCSHACDAAAQPYQFFWELAAVPDRSCGAQNIIIASFHIEDDRVEGAVRNGNKSFTFNQTLDLQNKAWHAYAVEITKDRISWFVDTKVIRTEQRSAALSGVVYRPQFRVIGQPGPMQPSRLEMDWVRYYDLARPNALPVTAPRMRKTGYTGGCASVARAETSTTTASSSSSHFQAWYVVVPVVVAAAVVAAVLIAAIVILRRQQKAGNFTQPLMDS